MYVNIRVNHVKGLMDGLGSERRIKGPGNDKLKTSKTAKPLDIL